ncbi:alpha/beta hydrolase [Nocardia sp. CDC159]|uniref:Alpha/beta hydrolase n=1 Tax=Nocardia pulmonis TaxID=2951408 RepID=A0A9X2EBC9_9NOCA|nr:MULTISPECIES: alpha/beta hydrolase [Nocardia]MCM6777602.1 alpha/beta hydrolase [Nocardia pulmonis]MCM6790594.1 alpha/beta hydrolase [Nocardia sp. CDC159]
MARMPGERRWWHRGLTALSAVVAVLLGWVAAVAAFFGAALAVAWIPVLLIAAAVAGFAISWGLARLLTRLTHPRPRRTATVVAAVGVAVLLILASLTVFQPLPTTPEAHRPAQPAAPMRYWTLETGSTLAVIEIAAVGPRRGSPIVIVGGGPGEADVADRAMVEFFGRLATLGHDVYIYDQIGAGLSERLANPAEYTVARHVDDLEALRRRIGVERVVLLGSSWGGSLVASYMARHPGRVERALFTSPGPIDFAQWRSVGTKSPSLRLPPRERQRADDMLPGAPRFLLWYLLGMVNPSAARNLISDREADAYFTSYLHLVGPGTVCDRTRLPNQNVTGNGFYDNVFTVLDADSGTQSHVRDALARDPTPALILTGACDYLPWEMARQYATTFPDATLVCFPDAGHVIRLDQPTRYFDTIRAFLFDQPLAPWTHPQRC